MSPRTIPAEDDIHIQYPAVLLSSRQLMHKEDNARDEIRELVIEVKRPEFSCKVGQSIGVLAPMPPSTRQPYHLRWYSIADIPESNADGNPCFTICVRRRIYKDKDSGLIYKGITSNFLCDLKPGDHFSVTGPYGLAFKPPKETDATLILIGTGTGIAPFRAFMKYLHQKVPDWRGTVRLFYGFNNGLDILYQNDVDDDVMQYFDEATYEAFKALSPPPHWADPIAWDMAFSERGDELIRLLDEHHTYVYVAGLESVRNQLDVLMSTLMGSEKKWMDKKHALTIQGRWVEVVY